MEVGPWGSLLRVLSSMPCGCLLCAEAKENPQTLTDWAGETGSLSRIMSQSVRGAGGEGFAHEM